MPFSFPLSRADFQNFLPINSVTFDLPSQIEYSGLGSGHLLTADVGPRLWSGEIKLTKRDFRETAKFDARLSLLREAGRSFFVYDVRQQWPMHDPGGNIVSGSAPVIGSIAANMREITVTGLPSEYVLACGDLISFSYGENPTRYALHRIVSGDVTADISGVTPLIEVTPSVRLGAATGDPVELVQPFCKAIIEPGSVRPAEGRGVHSSGLSFRFIQTLR